MKRIVQSTLLVCLITLFFSCKGKNIQKEEVIAVKTTQVTIGNGNGKKEFPFIAQPFRTSELSFRVGGPIDRLDVYAGNEYKQGSIIAEIDNRDFRIRKDRAEALYKQAKAEYERIRILYEKNNLPASTYEKAQAEYTSTKAAYDTALNELNDTRLIAPFNGYIGEVFAEKYQDIRASQPVITFIDIDKLKIEAYVTQDIAFHIGKSDSISLAFDVQSNKKYHAQLLEVSKSTTRNNLSYLLTAVLPNTGKQFLAGMSGKIYFNVPVDEQSLIYIPQAALCHRPSEGDYVWVVNTLTQTVNFRKVTIGELAANGFVTIETGLHPGETIATSGLRFLSDGMKVNIHNK